MPSIPVGFAQVKFEFTVAGQPRPICSTLGIGRPEGESNPLSAKHLADRMAEHFKAVFGAASTGEQWAFQGVTAAVQEMADSQDVAKSSAEYNFQGAWSQRNPPINCCLLVEKRTSKGGKRYRGRMYLPAAWVSSNATASSGQLDNGERDSFGSKLTAFYNAITSPTMGTAFQPVLLHNQGEAGGTNFIPTEITSFGIDPMLATQRKRMR
jgi:hypothetical protein